MFTSAYDLAHGAAVWLLSGDHNTDEDYESYLRSVHRLLDKVQGRDKPAAILVVDAGNPPPSATWRKRIAEETEGIGEGALYAIVSPSRVVRSTVTAINWFRPAPYEVKTFAHFEDAVAWIEERRGQRVPAFRQLLAEARDKAEQRSR